MKIIDELKTGDILMVRHYGLPSEHVEFIEWYDDEHREFYAVSEEGKRRIYSALQVSCVAGECDA